MINFLKNFFKAKKVTPLNAIDKTILNSEVFFYNQLSLENKIIFEEEIAFFLHNVPIYFQEVKETRLLYLLVASSAVIVTFGHAFRYKKHITSVTIVNGVVTKLQGAYTTGEVRFDSSFKTMYLSEQALVQGFKNNNDKKNVGIHEFVHVLDLADGQMDGIPSLFMQTELIEIWKKIAEDEMKNISVNNSTIRTNGATNNQEFFTVCSEYFFERPNPHYS